MSTDADFLARFDAAAIPRAAWTHEAHLRMAFLVVRDRPFADALAQIRTGIKRLNAANGVDDTHDAGYHETMTVAWATVVRALVDAHGPFADFDALLAFAPFLRERRLLLLYYSRDRLMSRAARRAFVPPDLGPLPEVEG